MSHPSHVVPILQQTRALYLAFDRFEHVAAEALGLTRSDLRCVARLEAPMTPSELAVDLGLSNGAISAMLNRLERRGWLTREASKNDRRSSVVTLVASKYKVVGGIYRNVAIRIAEVFATSTGVSVLSEMRGLELAAKACELATSDIVGQRESIQSGR